ncbi:protocatechuate 3,4-dioxygenase subunit alpha [Subtercola frigoramans]
MTMSEFAQTEFVQTPSQTVGPFYGFALPYEGGPELVNTAHPAAIRLHGRVIDGAGVGLQDALVEIWQPDENGQISRELGAHEPDGYTFTGFGRAATTRAGDFTFTTVKPGSVGGGAPYVLITVFARGLLHHLFTRAYFVDVSALEALAETDAVVKSVPADRRSTLVAVADGPTSYRFDVRLQGEGETVFLDFDA